MLTESHYCCSFIDCDMFMRHLSHGVDHLKYKQQHEKDPKHDTSMGQTLEEVSDLLDNIQVHHKKGTRLGRNFLK